MFHLTRVSEFRFKIYPNDFAQSRNFYENVLKYPVVNEWSRGEQDKGVMFDTGSAIIELLSPEKDYQSIQGVTLSLEVQDVNALWEYLKNRVPIIFSLRHNAWGDSSFCIHDPEGLQLTFFTKNEKTP